MNCFYYFEKERPTRLIKNIFDEKKNSGIKYVSWDYSCDEEYLEKTNYGKIVKYSSLPPVPPQNRLIPSVLFITLGWKQKDSKIAN